MTNEEKIKKIRDWQCCPYVHELTCGMANCREPLRGIEKDGKLVLVCLNEECDYEQTFIPEFIVETDLDGIIKFNKKLRESRNNKNDNEGNK